MPSYPSLTLNEPVILPLLLLLGLVWLIPHTTYPNRIGQSVAQRYQFIPSVKINLTPQKTFLSRYSPNKTALYIEPRHQITHLTPLLLHMIELVPSEWKMIFMGSDETVTKLGQSHSANRYVEDGKLHLRTIGPWSDAWTENWQDMKIDEVSSRILTNETFYDVEMNEVEHLFVFHSDAVLCANAEKDLNDWLGYDWVGAPWKSAARFGGNGGLSLRRVSKIKQVLKFQQRMHDTLPEDAWLSSRMGLLPDARMAPPEIESEFSVEDVWHDRPLGYHLNSAGLHPDVWQPSERRKAIFEYCPEIKIVMDMRLERERCPEPVALPMDSTPNPSVPDDLKEHPDDEPLHAITPEEYNAAMAREGGVDSGGINQKS